MLSIFLNSFRCEVSFGEFMRNSATDCTIIRPGGLKSDPPSGNTVLAEEDHEWFYLNA
jgi:hypothetical protein